jgi:hypothetical protein
MAQIKTTSEELVPTFWRLTKIYWSQFWRALVLVFPIFFFIFAYGAYQGIENFENPFIIPNITELLVNKKLILNYLVWLSLLYLLQCLLFRLIEGNTYSDFTITFVPRMDRNTPGYWPALFYVGWSYFWRTAIVRVIINVAESQLSKYYEPTIINGICFVAESLILILLLYFIVNKQYGKVRFSLLKPEVKV